MSSARSAQGQSALGLFDPSALDDREPQTTARDEAQYAALLRHNIAEHDALSDLAASDDRPTGDFDNLYMRAANLAARAVFDPSATTVAEHIELEQLRAELAARFGVKLP